MFAGFRRHQKWVWIIAIIVVIPSFVIFFTDYRVLGSRRVVSELGSINGRPITPEEYLDALAEAKLGFFFRYGSWPGKDESTRQFGFDEQRDAFGRLILIEKLRDLNVQVGNEAVVQMAAELLERISGGRGAGPEVFDAFHKQVLFQNGLTKADFQRFVEHEVGIVHLISVAGLAGRLTPPQEAELMYRRENEEVVAEAVFFSATNYVAGITNITPDALSLFYTNHQPDYRLRERVQVAYVKFEQTNFYGEADTQLAKITNFNQRAEALYMKRGTNYYTDEQGQPLPLAAALERIRKESRDELALNAARKKAFEFATKLAEQQPLNLGSLAAVAATNDLPLKFSEPFDDNGPKDLKVLATFAKAAFALTPAEPVSTAPLVGEDGVYLIALKEKFESAIPPLAAIRDKVTADYRQFQAEEMARSRGRIFYTTLTNGLATNKTFTAICLDSKLVPLSLPPLSRGKRSLDNLPDVVSLNEVKRLAFSLIPGTVSPLVPTSDGAMILFLRSRFPVSENKLAAELPAFLAGLRQNRQFEAADAWLQKQRQAMQVVMPAGAGGRTRPRR